MDRPRLVILIYTIIGLLLLILGSLIVVEIISGAIVFQGNVSYVIISIALFIIFLGLHWLIVGVASLRSA